MGESRIKLFVFFVFKCRTGPIIWLGIVLCDVVKLRRITEEKPAEMRKCRMWNGRIKEHVEADVMDMECGVLCVARRPVLTELLSTVEKIMN